MLEIISMLFHNNINNHDIKEDKDVSRFQVTLEWQMVVRKKKANVLGLVQMSFL